jgi:hypothetical protein
MGKRKVMKLVDPQTGRMVCRVCGAEHWANIKPNSGGHYYRGSWQCVYGCKPGGHEQHALHQHPPIFRPKPAVLHAHGPGLPLPVPEGPLVGVRMLFCSETGAGRRLDEDGVKLLTGSDLIKARRI